MSREQESRKNILQSVDAFIGMQKEHLAVLESGKLGRVSIWQQERQVAFLRLQDTMASFWGSIVSEDIMFRELIQKKIAHICLVEDMLATTVAGKKSQIKEKVSGLRKGKRALSGYSLRRGTTSAPRYLSSRS